MPKKKKFIDKKRAVTFQLIHRSQQDPLVVDEDAPQRILQPIQNCKETHEEREKRIEEQHKYGIYYNDDTNYLEFLKERSDNQMEWPSFIDEYIEERRTRFALPKEVFASTNEEEVGMLNRTKIVSGLHFDLDPDVVAALEDSNDQTEELEDNFIELADGVASDNEEIWIYDGYSKNSVIDLKYHDNSEKSEDEYTGFKSTDEHYDDEGSLTRNEISETRNVNKIFSAPDIVYFKDFQQEILTKQMNKMLKKYDDLESLTNDRQEVYGYPKDEAEQILKLGEEFFKSQGTHDIDRDEEAVIITKNIANRKNAFKTEYVEFDTDEKQKYDCQSIISTYSRTCHLPTLIKLPTKPKKIKVNEKTGIPMNVLGQNKLTRSVLNKHNEEYGDISGRGPHSIFSNISRLTALSIRDKDETGEEKKKRKKALKQYRQERRVEKKLNKAAFAAEKKNLAEETNNIFFRMGL